MSDVAIKLKRIIQIGISVFHIKSKNFSYQIVNFALNRENEENKNKGTKRDRKIMSDIWFPFRKYISIIQFNFFLEFWLIV